MTPIAWLGVFAGVAAVLTWAGTAGAIAALHKIGGLAAPNQRSSHVRPTPNGGGIALVLVVLAAWWIADRYFEDAWGMVAWNVPTVLGSAAALSILSLLDDVRGGMSPLVRLGAQTLAVIAGILTLPDTVFQDALPFWVDAAVTLVAWLWFINLFNFMDGIDGIAGAEVIAISIGAATIAGLGAMPPIFALYSMTAAAAAAGFLLWNWQPARVFLGDSGSVPLGYLLGWLLLVLAAYGHWQAALLLPLYFVADATVTLVRRLARGEKPWQAHRSHAYQRAAVALGSHAPVVVRIGALNVALVALAVLAIRYPESGWIPLVAGFGLTISLLWYFERVAAPAAR